MTQSYDALVIGAGPAGSVAALMLARAGWSVALVEKAEFPRRKVCGEYLSPTNQPLFADLGVADAIAGQAGPEIRRMALYARDAALIAAMPRPPAGAQGWGRALGRETLDTILRDAAVAAGATLFQPWSVATRAREDAVHRCTLTHRGQTTDLRAKILIDAHGAPDTAPAPHRASDLLGFKAHFENAALPPDLMPVLVFPGGYGGLVTTSGGRVTFGCCIRRDVMEQARTETAASAGQAVLHAVKHHCQAAAEVLAKASLSGPWLATGPIFPGIRPAYAAGTFHVGTAAGETHPLVGEGMSMAMQAAWLLATLLTAHQEVPTDPTLDRIGATYATAWRHRFAPRITAAALFANLAMRRTTVSLCLPILRRLPALLTYGAAHSGKTTLVVSRLDPVIHGKPGSLRAAPGCWAAGRIGKSKAAHQ